MAKPSRKHVELTADIVRERYSYDIGSGQLFHKIGNGKAKPGHKAGNPHRQGYLQLTIFNKMYYAHRIIWLHVYGQWPSGDIDHINGNPSDNRIHNLRDVSKSINAQNVKAVKLGKKYTSPMGAQFDIETGRWRSVIEADGKRIHLGRFDTADEAHQVYIAAKRRLHPGFCL